MYLSEDIAKEFTRWMLRTLRDMELLDADQVKELADAVAPPSTGTINVLQQSGMIQWAPENLHSTDTWGRGSEVLIQSAFKILQRNSASNIWDALDSTWPAVNIKAIQQLSAFVVMMTYALTKDAASANRRLVLDLHRLLPENCGLWSGECDIHMLVGISARHCTPICPGSLVGFCFYFVPQFSRACFPSQTEEVGNDE